MACHIAYYRKARESRVLFDASRAEPLSPTFNYAENGVVGLAKNKKAILVLASGGVFSEGPWKPWDFVEPYLRTILGFIGIQDVQTVRVEGTNIPALAASAAPDAEKAAETLKL
jgi:FMN-dependent NADH-azoreductase